MHAGSKGKHGRKNNDKNLQTQYSDCFQLCTESNSVTIRGESSRSLTHRTTCWTRLSLHISICLPSTICCLYWLIELYVTQHPSVLCRQLKTNTVQIKLLHAMSDWHTERTDQCGMVRHERFVEAVKKPTQDGLDVSHAASQSLHKTPKRAWVLTFKLTNIQCYESFRHLVVSLPMSPFSCQRLLVIGHFKILCLCI